MIILNGQQLDSVEYNGANLDKVIFNGVIVFERSSEDYSTTTITIENQSKDSKTITLQYNVEVPTVYINSYVRDSSDTAVTYTDQTAGQKSRSFTVPAYSTYIIEISGGKISEYAADTSIFLEGNIYTEAFLGTNITSCGGWLKELECRNLTIAADIPIAISHAYELETLTIIGPHVIESIQDVEGVLTSITIPAGSTIESGAFYHAYELLEARILGSNTVVNSGMFSGCYSLEDIYVHSTVPAASQGSWCGSDTVPTIHLPSTLDITQARALFGDSFNKVRDGRDYIELTTLFDL